MMELIEPPAYLKGKVLAEARELSTQAVASRAGAQAAERPVRQKRQRSRLSFVLSRSAATAAVVFALVFAGGFLVNLNSPQNSGGAQTKGIPFTISAYAAESGTMFASSDDIVAFGVLEGGSASLDTGMYTGCMFNVEGEGIVQIDFELSKGQIGIHAEQEFTPSSDPAAFDTARDEAFGAIAAKLGGSFEAESAIETSDDKITHTAAATRLLGSSCSVLVAPQAGGLDLTEIRFEFWLSPQDLASGAVWNQDLRAAWQQSLDVLNDASLKLTVHYADGSQVEQTFLLKTGKMKVSDIGAGSTVLPELASGSEPYIYAVYGVVVDEVVVD